MTENVDLRNLYPGIKFSNTPPVKPVEEERKGSVSLSDAYGAFETPGEASDGTVNLSELYPTIISPPSEKDVAREVGTGLLQGAVKYGPSTAGMVLGAKTGAVVSPLTGPFAPVVPFLGGALGLVGGYFLGEKAEDLLFDAPTDPALVPYREGAITAGGVLSSSPAAFFARGNPATRFGRLIDYMGKTARARPATYLGIEGLTAGATGFAGGTSEAYYPGQAGPRFGAELAASVFTPGRLLINTATSAYDGLAGAVRNARDPQATQFKQANALYGILDRVLAEAPAIKQLEELGTAQALQQAAQLRESYYKKLIRDLESIAPGNVKISPARPTAAQKTGDLGLSILELSLVKGDKAFGSVVQQQGLDALRANQLLIDAMNNVPDQRILALAASQQASLYDNMVAGRLSIAERNAADAARALNPNNPQSRKVIGSAIKDQVVTALDEARKFERGLWDNAVQSVAQRTVQSGALKGQIVERELVPKELLRSYLDEISGMTMERATMGMPAEVRAIMTRLGITQESIASYQKGKLTQEFRDTGVVPDNFLMSGIEVLKNGSTRVIPLGNKTTVQDLVNIRSDMLKYARDAAGGTANRNPSDANFFGNLAEGALGDLQTLNSAAYDKARTFSKSLNDVFRRSYANQITAVDRTGAPKIAAEVLVSRAFGRDADATALRMDQIESAVGFFKKSYDDAVATFGPNSRQALELKANADVSAGRVASITDAMERALRAAATDPTIVNPQTGRVNPQALANWMARNQETLKPFGSLTKDLTNALDAENAFRVLGDTNSAINKQLRDQQAFAALLPGGERPTLAVTSILDGKNPVAGMRKLTDIVKNTQQGGGPGALSGLKSSLFEYAYTKAGGTATDKFSISAFDDALFQPLAPGEPSVVSIMRSTGLMTMTEIKDLRRLINPMKRIESAMDNRLYLDQIIANTGAVSGLAVRLLALHGSSGAIPKGPGSLAAASAISSAATNVFNQLPRLNALAALKEIVQDPQLTAAMLKVGRTESEKQAILQNVQDRLSATGLIIQGTSRAAVPVGNVLPEAQEDQKQRREAARMLRQIPPAPSTRGMPGAKKPVEPAPSSSGSGSGGTSQDMFRSLFPFDTIGQLVGQPPKQ